MKPFYWSVFRFLRKGNLVSLDSTALSNSECLPSNTLSAQPHKCSKQIATLLRIAVVNRHALRNIWMQHIATLFKAQRVEHVGSTCCKALDGNGHVERTSHDNLQHSWNQLSFQEIFDHVPKLPKSKAKTKKNADAWCSEDGHLKYYLPLSLASKR